MPAKGDFEDEDDTECAKSKPIKVIIQPKMTPNSNTVLYLYKWHEWMAVKALCAHFNQIRLLPFLRY